MNHKVDHIMTNDPKQIKLISSAVTGRKMNNGYWDSDHAGLFSSLQILLPLRRGTRPCTQVPGGRPRGRPLLCAWHSLGICHTAT